MLTMIVDHDETCCNLPLSSALTIHVIAFVNGAQSQWSRCTSMKHSRTWHSPLIRGCLRVILQYPELRASLQQIVANNQQPTRPQTQNQYELVVRATQWFSRRRDVLKGFLTDVVRHGASLCVTACHRFLTHRSNTERTKRARR